MTRKSPGRASTRLRGEEFGKSYATNLVALTHNRNTINLARLRAYQNFGLELARRGEMNVSKFVATFIDFPESIQDELVKHLRDFTRVPIEVYEAAGAIRFPRRFIPLPGGRHE